MHGTTCRSTNNSKVATTEMAVKIGNVFNFVRLLTVEPLAFFSLFIMMFKGLPQDQMIQDKICLQRYNLPPAYCQRLPQMTDADDEFHMKSTILADVTQLNLYINLFITIPILLISILIGPFIDKYKPAKKMLLIFAFFVSFLENAILTYNSYFFTSSR